MNTVKNVFLDQNSNWRQLVLNILNGVNWGEVLHIFEALAVNDFLIGGQRRNEFRGNYGCNIPTTILMGPTSACNLKCTGCWAAEYGHSLNLTLEDMDNIIRQGEEFGCYIYLYSGGEPLMRKKDFITLYERYILTPW